MEEEEAELRVVHAPNIRTATPKRFTQSWSNDTPAGTTSTMMGTTAP